MKVNTAIFKTYDVRGVYPSEINEEIAEKIGRAAARCFFLKYGKKNLKAAVCRDARSSSLPLKNAVLRGIMSRGASVMDCGTGTTPYFSYLMRSGTKPDFGIMVTASHNPREFNGFKIRGRKDNPVSMGTGLEIIRKLVLRRNAARPDDVKGNIIPERDLRGRYAEFLAEGVSIGKIRAVIDAAGGSAAFFLPAVLNLFPDFAYKPVFFEPDGSFRRHSPNPLLSDSQKHARKELAGGNFGFGAVFDGDGDRVVFLDENGNFVRPEHVFALFAGEELKKRRGLPFVMPVNSSRAVREYVKNSGGKVKLTRVGYVFVREAMKRFKAPLGVEASGHFYFKKFFYGDSAIMALLRLAALLSATHRPFSRLVSPFASYVSSGEVNFPAPDKKGVMARIKKFYRGAGISELDGITAEFPEWWFNVRLSNTEDAVRMVLEAENNEVFSEKKKELEKLLRG